MVFIYHKEHVDINEDDPFFLLGVYNSLGPDIKPMFEAM